jgi:hypothetical protein
MYNLKFFFFITFLCHLHSQNSLMRQSVLSSGAINIESEQTKLVGTLGQIFTNKIISQNMVLKSGFWGSVAQITLGVDEFLPKEFLISKAYPNPFNPTVSIDFSIPDQTDVRIQVFDLLGRKVFTHRQDFNNPGKYRFQWNARDLNGKNVASGIYIVTIQHEKNIYKQKITFLK